MNRPRRIVVGIGGASGAIYAQRLITELVRLRIEVHLVVSPNGVRMFHDELGISKVDAATLAPGADPPIVHYSINDVGAAIASGTFPHDGMIIVPCSSNGLAMVACGLGPNLLYRAAAVTLKERRRLVICHREMPLPHIDIENMLKVSAAGAILASPNPGWYFRPTQIDEIVDFVVARLLDSLGIDDHAVGRRWGEDDDG